MDFYRLKKLEHENQDILVKKDKTFDQKYWIRLSIYFLNEIQKYLMNANEPILAMRIGSIKAQLEMV